MGCDIHAHIEVKIDGKWEHYSALTIRRNYRLFTRMASVRRIDDDVVQVAPLRGLPFDMTTVTKFDAEYWKNDMHHPSWITDKEADEVEQWFTLGKMYESRHPCEPFGYLFSNGMTYRANDRHTDTRIVFWFDN